MKKIILAFASFLIASAYPGDITSRSLVPRLEGGPARVLAADTRSGTTYTLINKVLAWSVYPDGRCILQYQDLKSRGSARMKPPNRFMLRFRGGGLLSSTDMIAIGATRTISFRGNPKAARLADRCSGKALQGVLGSPDKTLKVEWMDVLLNGSNYVRSVIKIDPLVSNVDVAEVTLVSTKWGPNSMTGTVPGSPIAQGNFFAGLEDPLANSVCDAEKGTCTCSVSRKLPILQSAPVTYSAVFGVTPAGQTRRAFLNYLERERAHPYRAFLHYNSWYDIGYFKPYTEADCLDSIKAFGQELGSRGVHLSSFLFDDGWDNPQTVWEFGRGFPHGFLPLKQAAAKYRAAPGIWLSPWGGYGGPREQRLKTGKANGYEVDSEGYALSGPRYFQRFRDVCLNLVRKQGINQFKLDGTGSPDKQFQGSKFSSDFEAAQSLITDLRAAKPDLFINLTTGTWPSPFWLRYADSIWRGGEDHSFAGVGPDREKWITYRDGDTYRGIVQQGRLYPLSSLMLHGLIYARHAHNLQSDPDNHFANEVHDYFGTGTQLQEMYITHSLLSKQNWDDLAEAAKWSYANQDVLLDTHWIGGDPLKLEVYGWADWSPRKGILVLRNPSDKAQSFEVDVQKAFELPEGAARSFTGVSPWSSDEHKGYFFRAGVVTPIDLKPFQVLTLDLAPLP